MNWLIQLNFIFFIHYIYGNPRERYHTKNLDGSKLLDIENDEASTCLDKDIIPQGIIHTQNLMGMWKTYAHTIPPDEYLFESGITEHLHRFNTSFQVKYAGYIQSQCFGPSLLESWLDTDNPGWVHSDLYNEKKEFYNSFSYRIMFANEDYVVLYSCNKILSSGKCQWSYPNVIINGRPYLDVDRGTWCKILKFIKHKLCIDPGNIRIQSHTKDCLHKLKREKGFLLESNYTKTRHPTMNAKNSFKKLNKRSIDNLKEIHKFCIKEINSI
ncbi:unnamed protein product [Gordionus sp. m RMFG-2023]